MSSSDDSGSSSNRSADLFYHPYYSVHKDSFIDFVLKYTIRYYFCLRGIFLE